MNPEDDTSPATPPPFDGDVNIPVLDPNGFDLGIINSAPWGGINPSAVVIAIAVLLVVVSLAVTARAIYSRPGITRGKKYLVAASSAVGLVLATVIVFGLPLQGTASHVPAGFSEWASETYDLEISAAGAAELAQGNSIAVERYGIRYIVKAGTDSGGLTYLFNGSGTEFMRAGMLDGGAPAIDPGPITNPKSETVQE
jgi:hypothetical protein